MNKKTSKTTLKAAARQLVYCFLLMLFVISLTSCSTMEKEQIDRSIGKQETSYTKEETESAEETHQAVDTGDDETLAAQPEEVVQPEESAQTEEAAQPEESEQPEESAQTEEAKEALSDNLGASQINAEEIDKWEKIVAHCRDYYASPRITKANPLEKPAGEMTEEEKKEVAEDLLWMFYQLSYGREDFLCEGFLVKDEGSYEYSIDRKKADAAIADYFGIHIDNYVEDMPAYLVDEDYIIPLPDAFEEYQMYSSIDDIEEKDGKLILTGNTWYEVYGKKGEFTTFELVLKNNRDGVYSDMQLETLCFGK